MRISILFSLLLLLSIGTAKAENAYDHIKQGTTDIGLSTYTSSFGGTGLDPSFDYYFIDSMFITGGLDRASVSYTSNGATYLNREIQGYFLGLGYSVPLNPGILSSIKLDYVNSHWLNTSAGVTQSDSVDRSGYSGSFEFLSLISQKVAIGVGGGVFNYNDKFLDTGSESSVTGTTFYTTLKFYLR
jgi:hypothetical protein